MTLDKIVQLVVKSLKTAFPAAIAQGFIVHETSAVNPATNRVEVTSSHRTSVEMIFDTFKTEEVNGTTILQTDVKLYIIADRVKSLDWYSRIETTDGRVLRLVSVVEAHVGYGTALFTVVARK